MKFRTKFRKITYVVRRQDIMVESGLKTVTKGLRAEFVDHSFDSETAQRRLGWTDADREAVEAYLIGHSDFGKGLYLVQGDDQTRVAETTQPHTCLAIYVVQGESQSCGRPCEGDFCPEHEAEFASMEEVTSA